MNKFVVAILACVAGCALGDYFTRDSAGVMIDVPNKGGYVIELHTNSSSSYLSEEDSEGLPYIDVDEIEYTIHFYYVHQGRSIITKLYIGDEEKDTFTFGDNEFQTRSYKLKQGETLTAATSVAFTVEGLAGDIVDYITIVFWARFKKNGEYLHGYSKENPMPVYYKTYSPLFDIDENENKYFAYEASQEEFFIVRRHNDIDGSAHIYFGEDQTEKKYKEEIDLFPFKNVTFAAGKNLIRVHGDNDDHDIYFELGAFESASSSLKAISFALLCALCALLF